MKINFLKYTKKYVLQTTAITGVLFANIPLIKVLADPTYAGPILVGDIVIISSILLGPGAYKLGEKETQNSFKNNNVNLPIEGWPNDWFITNDDIMNKNKVKTK